MGSTAGASVFTAAQVAQAPEDPLFGLMRAYRQDPSDKKVDLGIGAYRDDHAKPWILPVVKKVFLTVPFIEYFVPGVDDPGRPNPAQRPQPRPRVSPHLGAGQLHRRCPEADPGR